MKKILLLVAMALTMALTSCLGEQWLTNNDDYRYDNRYGNNPPPPPPGDNRYDNRYGHGGYYDNRGGYYDNRGRGGYNYNGRPAIGTEVSQLPNSARRVVSGGQELYIYNGVMYQPSRSRAGVVYRVVGYSDY